MYCGPLKWIVASKMKNIYLENIYLAMDPVCLGRFFIEKTLLGYLKRKMLNQLEVKAFAKKSWSTIQTQAWV